MKFTLKYATAFLLLYLAGFSTGLADTDPGWKLRRDRDGIQVFTRKVEGSPYAAVRATTVLTGVTLTSLVALIGDAEACPNWADKCAESYIYERISETESYVYTNNDMPFPVKDRDVLSHVKWSQDPDGLEVLMSSEATTGKMEKIKKRVRLTQAKVSWRFKPLASGGIEVTTEAHINPGSGMPGWITNMLLVNTPFQTLKSFGVEVVKEKYQNATLEFIQEPPNE